MTIIPPKLPADGQSYQAAMVSLVDAQGLPSAALKDLTVYLSSSLTNIVAVPDSVTISAGDEYVLASAQTTPTPGTASITASSNGLASATAGVSTVTPSGYPSKLKVFVSPTKYLRRADTGTIRVELVDDAGLPSKAISPVTAQLSSSNVTIASLTQSSLTIPLGSIFVSGTFHTSASSGHAVITVSSTGYRSGGAVVTVVPLNSCWTSCGPASIVLKPVPGTLPTDGISYDSLEVGLATSNGGPVISSSDTIVQLFSDKSDVVSVPEFVTIPAGRISSLATISTSALEGKATITALSANLLEGSLDITTKIPAPSKLQAYVAPPTSFIVPNGELPVLVVQLQDSSGNPARARQATLVTVTSSNGSMLTGSLQLNIAQGGDYVKLDLNAKGNGKSTLTASSQGLLSSRATLDLARSPLVSTLTSRIGRTYILSNQTMPVDLSVSFLGKPLTGLRVDWIAQPSGVFNPANGSTVSTGHSYSAYTPIANVPASGLLVNLTASITSAQLGTFTRMLVIQVFQVPTKPAPTPFETLLSFWYIIVAVVVAAGVAVFFLLRMRRKKQRAAIEAGFEVV